MKVFRFLEKPLTTHLHHYVAHCTFTQPYYLCYITIYLIKQLKFKFKSLLSINSLCLSPIQAHKYALSRLSEINILSFDSNKL